MDKYYELIEFLKTEYLGQAYVDFGEEVPEVVNSLVPNFDIKSSTYDDPKLRYIKLYEIKSKKDDKCWKFILGPSSILYAANMEKYREELLGKNSVIGIFTLKNAFFRLSSIPTAVIVLGNGSEKIWLTSALTTEDVIVLFKDISTYKRKVYFTDQLETTNFMPEYYNGELNAVNAKLDKYETKKLQDIADIINGKNAGRDHLNDVGIPYLRGRNIQEGKIVNVDTFVKMEVAEEYAKQLLEEGDILLQKQFGYHKIAQITADDLPAIASSGLFIIRAYGVPGAYLFQYLTSETGKEIFDKQLRSIEKGATIVSISIKDLRDLRVPIFDEQTMSDFCNVDTIKADELIPVMQTISNNAEATQRISPSHMGAMLEEKVFGDFINAGWKESDLKSNPKGYAITLNNSQRWIADIVLLNSNKLLAVVEVKTDFSRIDKIWIDKMYAIVRSGEAPFLILTTGSYYEIHAINDAVVKKMTTTPTKELLLSLLEGKEDR